MATQDKDPVCDALVQKLTTGQTLDESEKTHLAQCEGCLARVVNALDTPATAGTNGDRSRGRPEAKKALEQGRQVFKREFGILLPQA